MPLVQIKGVGGYLSLEQKQEIIRKVTDAVVSVDHFIKGLTVSGLMSADEVHALLVSLPPDLQRPTVKSLAAELVRRGKLTKYQAGRIASHCVRLLLTRM